jgi:hypothetical protein
VGERQVDSSVAVFAASGLTARAVAADDLGAHVVIAGRRAS